MKEVFGTYNEGMKLADLHFHSNVSQDVRQNSGMEPEEAVELAIETGLHLIAITDHHDIRGAERAKAFVVQNNYPIEVVTGIEVDTPEGHVVGLFVTDPIEKSLSIEQTIIEVHRQGGLVIAPHPFLRSPLRKPPPIGIQADTLTRIMNNPNPEVYFDGYEVYSQGAADVVEARMGRAINANPISRAFYMSNIDGLGAAVASSDGHGCTIGRARTGFHGSLREAIANKNTVALVLEEPELFNIYTTAVNRFGSERVEGLGGKLRDRLRRIHNAGKEE